MSNTESTLRIAAELESLSLIRLFVQETSAAFGIAPDAIPDVLLATDEAATNVIVHGYRDEPGMLEIKMRRSGDSLVVCLRDQAPPFDPTTAPPPNLSLPLEKRPLGGMGIHLIRQLVDDVTHRVTPQGGNELTMVKRGVV